MASRLLFSKNTAPVLGALMLLPLAQTGSVLQIQKLSALHLGETP